MASTINSRMRGIIFGATLFVLAALAASLGWMVGRSNVGSPPAGSGDYPAILSDFSLVTLDGEKVGPETLQGKIVVVDFWATWCRPCDVQAKLLDMVHKEYHDRGVEFLAVSVGEDAETVRNFVDEKPYPYTVLIDPEGTMLDEGEVYMLPTVMILDRDRNVAFLRSGITGAPKLRTVLDGMISS